MYNLDYLEFYITNVCNLNCTNCNRCNNFNFSGHSLWNEYQQDTEKWSKILNVKEIGILGGEPMLNPDFMIWVKHIADLWPSSKIRIITNGTQLKKWPGLYDLLAQYIGRIEVEVNCHNVDTRDQILNDIKSLVKGPLTERWLDVPLDRWVNNYNSVKDPSWPVCNCPEDFFNLPDWIQKECKHTHNIDPEYWVPNNVALEIVDHNNVAFELHPAGCFNNSTVIYDAASHSVSLHDNNPEDSMKVCYFKKCHHIIKGKLYKCGPVGILPEFVKQFKIDLTPKQKTLINTYEPAEHTWSADRLQKFIESMVAAEPIPQCSLCPASFEQTTFKATNKKIKLVKI